MYCKINVSILLFQVRTNIGFDYNLHQLLLEWSNEKCENNVVLQNSCFTPKATLLRLVCNLNLPQFWIEEWDNKTFLNGFTMPPAKLERLEKQNKNLQ